MRTLLVAPALHSLHGGIPRILRLYQRALVDLGDEVDVLVLNDTPADVSLPRDKGQGARDRTAADGPRDALPQAPGSLRALVGCSRSKPRFVLQLLRLGWRADRIVCGHVHLAPAVRWLQRLRPRLEVFIVGHGIEIWRELSPPQLAAVRAATRTLCVSEFSRRELLAHNPGLPADRVDVVPNGLPPDFAPAEPSAKGEEPSADDERQSAGSEGQKGRPASPTRELSTRNSRLPGLLSPSLLCVSRLTSVDREKGVETVIAAMPQVLADFPGATLRIVGTGDDRRRLEALAAAQSAKGEERSVVEFLGSIDDATLRSEYAACDLFVLPSRKEGFGLVYLEALAHGKPCVAADAGGAPEVLGAEALPQAKGADALPRAKGEGPRARRTDAGILVPYGDAEAVAAAIKDLLRNPPDPAVVRTQAERFSYEAFRARLAAALKGVRGKG